MHVMVYFCYSNCYLDAYVITVLLQKSFIDCTMSLVDYA